jgi:RNA recognition motif-containing protein
VQNRARFLLEVVDTVLGVWPAGQVGVCLGNGSVADNRIKSPIIMKLYVGNLSFDMTERTLRELFEPFGTVSEVKLIMDRETGQSRGFGFVTMGNDSEGNAAIKGLDYPSRAPNHTASIVASLVLPRRARTGKADTHSCRYERAVQYLAPSAT